MRGLWAAVRGWIGWAFSTLVEGLSALGRGLLSTLSAYMRDLFLFGGLACVYLGLAGFDERWALIVVGLLLIYLAVPRGRAGGNEESE